MNKQQQNRDEAIRSAVAEYFSDGGPLDPIPPDIARLARLAASDLWNGPIVEPDDGEPWPGFSSACEQVAAWADDALPFALYFDEDADLIGECNPWEEDENYLDPDTETMGETYYGPDDVIELNRRAILAALFDPELVSYIA